MTFDNSTCLNTPTPMSSFFCYYLNQALNVSLTVCLLVSMQLKKDKERLQAMMAHLKSSEPKPAAQPVSTCWDSFN